MWATAPLRNIALLSEEAHRPPSIVEAAVPPSTPSSMPRTGKKRTSHVVGSELKVEQDVAADTADIKRGIPSRAFDATDRGQVHELIVNLVRFLKLCRNGSSLPDALR